MFYRALWHVLSKVIVATPDSSLVRPRVTFLSILLLPYQRFALVVILRNYLPDDSINIGDDKKDNEHCPL